MRLLVVVPITRLAVFLVVCAGVLAASPAARARVSSPVPPTSSPPRSAVARATPIRVLVKLAAAPRDDAAAARAVAGLSRRTGIPLRFDRRTVFGWLIVELDVGAPAARAHVAALARAPGVVDAEVVSERRPLRAPDDGLYDELWGMQAIDIELAWDQTIGTSSQRIGLVDTGIARAHIDLAAKDVFGWDFISDPERALDGDGRDADYEDDDPDADFHGSHVAGTMAARTDDGTGVAGVNWRAGLVTARAMGSTGGDVVDIVEAASWLAGFDVAGAPDIGDDRVSVVNLSVGADEPCSAFERDAYDAIQEDGVAIVASAGNSGNDAPTGAPASCPGVVAVAAFDASYSLAPYSSFDARIDVVAPGGDDDAAGAGIVSVDGRGGWVSMSGTSMAAPHVAGVVSLMQAVDPTISPAAVRAILRSSEYTCDGCDDVALLDARDAVERAAGGPTPHAEAAHAAPLLIDDGAAPPRDSARIDGAASCSAAPAGPSALALATFATAAMTARRTRARARRRPPCT